MNADEFRNYILGFIFYKYLSDRMELFANEILKQVKLKRLHLLPIFSLSTPHQTSLLRKRKNLSKTTCLLKGSLYGKGYWTL